LSTKDLVTLGNLLSTKFLKPQKYVTPSKQALLPHDLKNKVLKQTTNESLNEKANLETTICV